MRSAIYLATMTDAADTHDLNLVGNLVNDAIITYADAPVSLASGEFAAARWSWVCRQGSNYRDHAVVISEVSRERSFSAARSSRTRYMVTFRCVRQGSLPADGNATACGGRV